VFLQLKPVQGHPRWVSIEQRPSPVTINTGSFSGTYTTGNSSMLWLVAMQAVGSSMTALLAAAPSPEGGGGGGVSRGEGNGDRAGAGSNEFGLARLGAAGPERALWSRTHAEATRNNERHRKIDKQQQRRGRKHKKGETGDDKCGQHGRAEEREQRQWKWRCRRQQRWQQLGGHPFLNG
jgi:hypothetical protein